MHRLPDLGEMAKFKFSSRRFVGPQKSVFRRTCSQRDCDAVYYAIEEASDVKLSCPIISALDISQTISSQ